MLIEVALVHESCLHQTSSSGSTEVSRKEDETQISGWFEVPLTYR